MVGGGRAGLSVARTLRSRGYVGQLTLVGEEPVLPYDRPALSAEFLRGDRDAADLALCQEHELEGVQLKLGVRAVELATGNRTITLSDGEELAFDALVIASGCSPRSVPWAYGLDNVHVLRTLADAAALRRGLLDGCHVAVIGAGFLGAEVASVARALGKDVTLIELDAAPLMRVLGAQVGDEYAKLHRERGVDVRCATAVVDITSAGSLVRQLHLSDGSVVKVDTVVVAIGVRPNVDWLTGSGVPIVDGVVCDEYLCAAPGIYAAGDVARWHHPDYGPVRVEHWTNAADQAAVVAQNLLNPDQRLPYRALPYVWSDQYGSRLQIFGDPTLAAEVEVNEGSPARPPFLATYRADGKLVAAVGIGTAKKLLKLRRVLEASASGDGGNRQVRAR